MKYLSFFVILNISQKPQILIFLRVPQTHHRYRFTGLCRRGYRQRSHPGAVVGDAAAAGQAGVKVGDAVGAADRSVLVDFTATVDVAAAGEVPLGHGQGRSDGGNRD